MREDREADREVDGGEDGVVVRQAALLDEDDREHDGGQAAGAEPAEESDRRSPRGRPEEGDRDGKHSHDRQAEYRVQRDGPGQLAERRPEQDGAEDDERHRAENRAALLEQVAHLSSALSAQPPEDESTDERGDEAGAAER